MDKVILLFDIDGTLLLTGGAGKVAFEKAVEETLGIASAWGALKPDGKTDPLIIEEILSPLLNRALKTEEYDQLCNRYHFHFEQDIHHSVNFRVMPGIRELLPKLAKQNHLYLGIATGNFEIAAKIKLRKAELHPYFKFGGYASDSGDRKELTKQAYLRGLDHIGDAVPTEKVFVIGDTIHDIAAGKSLGAKTIAVATGSTPMDILQAHQPTHCLEDLSNHDNFLEILQ